ncbi:MAG: pentapeptide repeat-containing protein [Holosporales bacterium]|jgi:hypothetical protein
MSQSTKRFYAAVNQHIQGIPTDKLPPELKNGDGALSAENIFSDPGTFRTFRNMHDRLLGRNLRQKLIGHLYQTCPLYDSDQSLELNLGNLCGREEIRYDAARDNLKTHLSFARYFAVTGLVVAAGIYYMHKTTITAALVAGSCAAPAAIFTTFACTNKKRLLRAEPKAFANLTDADLSNGDYFLKELNGITLTGANLNKANFSMTSLTGAKLDGANLNKTNFSMSNLNGADFTGAVLTPQTNFYDARLSGAVFINTDLKSLVPTRENWFYVQTNDEKIVATPAAMDLINSQPLDVRQSGLVLGYRLIKGTYFAGSPKTVNMVVLPEDLAKLNPNELNALMPHLNEEGQQFALQCLNNNDGRTQR